jgi:hypothetical protein
MSIRIQDSPIAGILIGRGKRQSMGAGVERHLLDKLMCPLQDFI